MNILIAVPSMDSVPAVFAQSLSMLEKEGNCAVAFQVGSLVYHSRNDLAKKALEMGADYVMWFDSDMVFEPSVMRDMLKTMREDDIDFLTGIYHRRVEPYTPTIFKKAEIFEADQVCNWQGYDDFPENQIFEIEACGFGCVLMSTQILFDVGARYRGMFDPIGNVGEDISFCWRARQCGYELYADPSIKLGHASHSIITRDFYRAYKGAKGNGTN